MTNKATFRASSTQQGLTENMQILTGQKGDKLDKALTLREAAALGMVNLRRNVAGQVVPELPPSQPSEPQWSGVQPPVAPARVTADGAFHTIVLTWDTPNYSGHSYAEILRSQTNNPATAVRIGTSLANIYSDSVGKGFAAFYWVRFVNKNGAVGPLHSAAGLSAKTSPNIDEILASATNFAIYNPAKPTEKEIIFGVTDDGKVAIREAVIKAATIQIIHSERITADFIKAGVSISAPLITGGQLDMGNAFMAGGAAGFGKGGPYSSWGWGWNTMIYADGSLYTNRLRAEGGYVRNMTLGNCTMGNCTIEENCVVRGTVYAEKIVGDVYAARLYTASGQALGGTLNTLTINITDKVNFNRIVIVPAIGGKCTASRSAGAGSVSVAVRARFYATYNGEIVFDETVESEAEASEYKQATASVSFKGFNFGIPRNTSGKIELFITKLSNLGAISGSESGFVEIFKESGQLG